MANSADPDVTARLKAVSSGSILFAKVSFFVFKDESVKLLRMKEPVKTSGIKD